MIGESLLSDVTALNHEVSCALHIFKSLYMIFSDYNALLEAFSILKKGAGTEFNPPMLPKSLYELSIRIEGLERDQVWPLCVLDRVRRLY